MHKQACTWHRAVWPLLLVVLMQSLGMVRAHAAIQFEDATNTAFPPYSSESWGASIGDYNGDYWPDIFVGNHRDRPSLYRNNGDGTFTNVILQLDTSRTWLSNRFQDHHGAAWADIDADGDDDLLSPTNAESDAQFMLSDGLQFTDEAVSRGLNSDGGGWAASWLDFSGDGLIDLARLSFNDSDLLMQDTGGGFVAGPPIVCNRDNYGQLTDVNGDGSMEFICVREGVWPQRVYDLSTNTPVDITASVVEKVSSTIDTVSGDFNNDLRPDIFALRGLVLPNEAKLVNANRVEAALDVSPSQDVTGMQFENSGEVTLTVYSRFATINIFQGLNTTPNTITPGTPFTLDPLDPVNYGERPEAERVSRQIYVSYDVPSQTWTIYQSGLSGWWYTYMVAESADDFSNVVTLGQSDVDFPTRARILRGSPTGYVNATYESGFQLSNTAAGEPLCSSVASGDFDNDMDLDLYLVCRSGVENLPNRLFENQGDGSFLEVPVGGAAGALGVGLTSGAGIAENVVTADFDNDGFLDLFVTNGLNTQPLRVGGPHQVFRNTGNTNNWVALKLRGTSSNPDAVGARVVATTADSVQQLREQNGGYHRWAQNDRTIHFGLAQNALVDLEVTWPNGLVEVFQDVAANSLYEVVEGVGISAVIPGAPPAFPAPSSGDECSAPPFLTDLDRGLFIYRDCGTDQWHLRISGGGAAAVNHIGNVETNQTFLSAEGFSLEGGDTFSSSSNRVDFDLAVGDNGIDGVEFELQPGASGCVTLSEPSDLQAFVGQFALPISLPFDVSTLGPCSGSLPSLSIAGATVIEGSTDVSLDVTLSAAATDVVNVDFASVDGTAIAGEDYTAGSGTLTFAAGETSRSIVLSLLDDTDIEPVENFQVQLSNPIGATVSVGTATVDIIDDDAPVYCGDPNIDGSVDAGVYLWNDCGVSDQWHLEAVAGGSSTVHQYGGSLTTDASFSAAVGIDIETSDTLSIGASQIDFNLLMLLSGRDGIDFSVPAGAETCFELPVDLPGAGVFVGASRQPVSPAFALETLAPCGSALPAISISDASGSENDASLAFSVTLSMPSATTVSIDVTTVDTTAVAGEDYVAVNGSVTFAPGETVQQLSIDIIDDVAPETSESFEVQLSNPVGASVDDGNAIGVIDDNDQPGYCGDPQVNGNVDAGLFVWKDCGASEVWTIEGVAGGSSTVHQYTGTLTSDQVLTNAVGIGFESSDSLNATGNQIDYTMLMLFAGSDAVQFDAVPGASLCFDVSVNAPGEPIYWGVDRAVIAPGVDLETLAPCGSALPQISVDDITVSEDDGSATFIVSMSAPAAGPVTVDYATIDASAIAGSDYQPASGTLTFAPGETGQTVNVALVDDGAPEADETFQLTLTNADGATINVPTAQALINDDDQPAYCGDPGVNGGVDAGLFIWKDCGATELWNVEAAAGGSSTVHQYTATLSTDQSFANVNGVSLEASDSLTVSTSQIDFTLLMLFSGLDGLSFELAAGASTCLDVSVNSPGAPVRVGAGRTILAPPFDIETLGACSPGSATPQLSVQPASTLESSGTVDVVVSLDAPATAAVSVNFSTRAETAVGGSDFYGTFQTLSFAPGEISKTVTITVIDDAVPESEEFFTARLFNASGAAIANAEAAVTITDDD